jgi:alpha-glucosidase (family GH31 glycosyl hydrolase)
MEISRYEDAAIPEPSQLYNPDVETICRKYLELRYRLLPYLYSVVHESTTTAMPIMRSLWLHYPDDPHAVACADQYLWGSNLLVAPVVEKGTTSRRVYLPRGNWYDFWTSERIGGGREINRDVDLATLPLYVRAGSLLPLGPVKQYVGERSDQPLTICIYPGADGNFLLYEDDGKSFDFRSGEWMGIEMAWNDAHHTLSLRLAERSKMLLPTPRRIELKLGQTTRPVQFDGSPRQVQL